MTQQVFKIWRNCGEYTLLTSNNGKLSINGLHIANYSPFTTESQASLHALLAEAAAGKLPGRWSSIAGDTPPPNDTAVLLCHSEFPFIVYIGRIKDGVLRLFDSDNSNDSICSTYGSGEDWPVTHWTTCPLWK